MGICSVPLKSTETTWTLVVENKLGKVKLTDEADMTTRGPAPYTCVSVGSQACLPVYISFSLPFVSVHMFAPDNVTYSHMNARNVRLTWTWSNHYYNNLNITCQVNVSSHDTYVIVSP